MVNKGYDQYLRSKIMTASKAELTLMLYDGAIKFCNIALMCIEKKDIPGANTNIQKVEAIIEEFQATLDHKYPVAKDFENVYNYLYDRLVMANIKKDLFLNHIPFPVKIPLQNGNRNKNFQNDEKYETDIKRHQKKNI